MNRKFVMGKTFENAMLKELNDQNLSERDKMNWIDNIPIIQNPLSLKSSDLELRLFTYKHAKSCQKIRQLTITELQCLNFISRLYGPDIDNIITDFFAIEFIDSEISDFSDKIKFHNMDMDIGLGLNKKINPNILKSKKVWRVILLENIEDYELQRGLLNLQIKSRDEIDLEEIGNELNNIKIL